MNSRIKDIAGRKFGRLTALKLNETIDKPGTHWDCLCDCGNKTTVYRYSLISNATRSCGCLRQKAARKRATHGMSQTPEYAVWVAMKMRVTNPANKSFEYYGGRGIYICDRWLDSFENFFADMGKRPTKKHTLERVNNDGPYAPDNCIWATRETQNDNTSRVHQITYMGQTHTIRKWARILGVKANAIRARKNRGWSDDRTIGQPFRKSPNHA